MSTGFLTITSLDDATRLTTTNEGKAVCESVAVIPTDDTEYQVYVIVKRTINGATNEGKAVCESVAVIPTDDTEYQVYVIVKRLSLIHISEPTRPY